VTVDDKVYWTAWGMAGDAKCGYLPSPVDLLSPVCRLPAIRNAVYLAATQERELLYVGSVARAHPTALRDRVAEHVRENWKAWSWAWLWVVPLKPDIAALRVREVEGRIGRRFGPPQNRRLPR
jgi:hypothetical protein